jgi:hypothetical protein
MDQNCIPLEQKIIACDSDYFADIKISLCTYKFPSVPCQPSDNESYILHKVQEMFGKNIVSEGRRKAHYEELDGEKKRNKDRIKQLKKEIEDLHVQLSNTGQVCLLLVSFPFYICQRTISLQCCHLVSI